MKSVKKLFYGGAAWATKEDWLRWHFYYHSVTPLCTKGPNIFKDDSDLLISKEHPADGCCEKCIRQGQQKGYWQ